LRTAQEGDVAGESPLAPEDSTAEIEKLVHSGEHGFTIANIITEINDPVPLSEAVAYRIVQADEALCSAVYSGDRPDPPGIPQLGEFLSQTLSIDPAFHCGTDPARMLKQ
jgi:hypothetical protein